MKRRKHQSDDEYFDLLLTEAMDKMAAAEYDALMSDCADEEIDPELDKKIRQLIRGTAKSEKTKNHATSSFVRFHAKKIAVWGAVAIAAIVLVTTQFETVKLFLTRSIFRSSEQTIESEHEHVDPAGTSQPLVKGSYLPSVLPVGFEKFSHSFLPESETVLFKKGDSYISINANMPDQKLPVDSEALDIGLDTDINGYKGKLISKSNQMVLVWTQNGHTIMMQTDLSKEQLFMIANSVSQSGDAAYSNKSD